MEHNLTDDLKKTGYSLEDKYFYEKEQELLKKKKLKKDPKLPKEKTKN